MVTSPARITSEVLQHADGRPIAYTDATGVAVFIYQEGNGTYVIEICTRDNTGSRRCILLDGAPLTPQSDSSTVG